MDKWIGFTMEDIRVLEDLAQRELDEVRLLFFFLPLLGETSWHAFLLVTACFFCMPAIFAWAFGYRSTYWWCVVLHIAIQYCFWTPEKITANHCVQYLTVYHCQAIR